ncbi:GntR family transcriptional regulator [Pseudomonas sp. LB-090624]|uniref:GntR family transcriptional regulator n=1 Tax=Pseudomonas sp. LB-090624 TaxID=2213079 RepID=UPI000D94E0FF|nr:GntR family transcriptional regulator [Pseudomonas sp. LB-090624]PYB78905.1 GntR family transcriptional regulator [Pseudomonas sp. LB-090624]
MTQNPFLQLAAPLRQQTADLLRAAIVAMEFKPGERLIETRLCERFDVSRTVVREVLRQLEAEGIVEMIPRRGPRVAILTEKDIRDLYELRGVLEGLIGQLFAVRASAAQCAEVVALTEQISGSLEHLPVSERTQLKDRYYHVLLAGADNEAVERALRAIHSRTELLRAYTLNLPGRALRSVEEIKLISDAAAVKRDPVAAREACEKHVQAAYEAAKDGFHVLNQVSGE